MNYTPPTQNTETAPIALFQISLYDIYYICYMTCPVFPHDCSLVVLLLLIVVHTYSLGVIETLKTYFKQINHSSLK